MTVGFGEDEEIFSYSVFIVLVNRIVTILTSAGVLVALGLPLTPSAPVLLFGVPSLANVIGSAAQYEALKYVSFPLQALAKCAKSVRVCVEGMGSSVAALYYYRYWIIFSIGAGDGVELDYAGSEILSDGLYSSRGGDVWLCNVCADWGYFISYIVWGCSSHIVHDCFYNNRAGAPVDIYCI